jgi:hypothetical protein
MAQTHDIFVSPAPTYITPINCPRCEGRARLTRRTSAVTGGGRGEVRTFTCDQCDERIEMFLRDEPGSAPGPA